MSTVEAELHHPIQHCSCIVAGPHTGLAGLRTNDLSGPGRQPFRDLIHLYIKNMDEGHARVKMDEVDRYLDQTWFTWIGGTQPDSAFYYRVNSPVVLIEFDHQQPANLRKFAADPTKPTQQHIHCVLRTPNGNDNGRTCCGNTTSPIPTRLERPRAKEETGNALPEIIQLKTSEIHRGHFL